VRIPVTFNLMAVPTIASVAPNPIPRNQETRITITGSGFASNSEVFAGTSRLQTTFLNATTLNAVVPAVLLTGTSPLQLTVRNLDAASTVFTVQVGIAAPTVAQTGIVNTATGLPGFVAPGELVSILGRDFGPDRPISATVDASGVLGTTLAETRVLFDGVAAPIIGIAPNQVNAIVPNGVAGRTSTQVEVEFRGQRSTPVSVGIGPAVPGLFTANSTGSGQAAALNDNFSSNSPANPAARGSLVILYATGVGLTNPATPDGQIIAQGTALPTPLLPISVQIGDVPAEVVFAGGSPGLISGVIQINARIAENVTPGDAVPVVLTVGTAASRPGVTVSVR
jgi:uncharacterized protein (TIGR03437 family)